MRREYSDARALIFCAGPRSRHDAELSIRVSAWLLLHPDSGLRIRQVPFPGMDTKWLEDHRALVGGLLGAARSDGATDLGLAPGPVFHDLLVLDPAYRARTTGAGFPRASRIALGHGGRVPRDAVDSVRGHECG